MDLEAAPMRVACILQTVPGIERNRVLDIALVVCPSQNDFPGPHEARQVVDVAVGLVIEHALAQPDHLADTEIGAQVVLDLLAAQGWITVGIEQAFFGDQYRALAIDMQGAPFIDDGRPVSLAALDLENLARHQLILVPGEVEATVQTAPGIEVPVDTSDSTTPVDHKRR